MTRRKIKSFLFGLSGGSFSSRCLSKKVLDMMMASLSNTAKVILGGDMGSEELLLLPSKWEGCKLWGVYTDIFKKDTLVPVNPSRGGRTDFGGVVTFDRDETVDEAARYCGSGTDRKNGVAARMNMYPAMRNGTRKAEPGAHADFLKRKDPNLRLIAVFDPSATAKPYVLLMEQLLSILLQTLNIGTTKKFMRASTIAMIRRATPRDLPQPQYERLNNAAQCLQGLFYTRHGGSVCANENCGTTETDSWCSADPGVPFSRVICSTCYYYRRKHNGEERPAKLAAKPKGSAEMTWQNKQAQGQLENTLALGVVGQTLRKEVGSSQREISINPDGLHGSAVPVGASRHLRFQSMEAKKSSGETSWA